ncbi:hypothetical protein NHQ30_004503 [Ciborinia camelliae]|nr:hypothetical protein NHQ30_004503 [Ciborinia camelliae]
MFTGDYGPIVQSYNTRVGNVCTVKNDCPAGTIVHWDTILLSFSYPSRNAYPTEASVMNSVRSLNQDSTRSFYLLEHPADSVYDIFTKNAVKFPALASTSNMVVVPTHGMPFEHSCTPTAICVVVENRIEVRLTKPVKRNEKISLCYSPMMLSAPEREQFLHHYFKIQHSACHTCLLGGQEDDKRAVLFGMWERFEKLGWAEVGEGTFRAEVDKICERVQGQSLEPYFWEFFSVAEYKAREARFSSHLIMAKWLLETIRIQGGEGHPEFKRTKDYISGDLVLEDDMRLG